MKEHLRRTFKNKIFAVGLGIIGYLSTLIDGDVTAFVFLLLIATPLFFANENYID